MFTAAGKPTLQARDFRNTPQQAMLRATASLPKQPFAFFIFHSAFLLSVQQEPAAWSLHFNLQCTDDDNRSYRNVCNMSFVSFSLAVNSLLSYLAHNYIYQVITFYSMIIFSTKWWFLDVEVFGMFLMFWKCHRTESIQCSSKIRKNKGWRFMRM